MNDQSRPSISVFFPAYNDAASIPVLVDRIFMLLPKLADDYEVIVVNDASPDNLAEVLVRLQAKYPRLRVVTHSENRGYGGALQSGFRAATKDLVFYTDGDGQYDVAELERLMAQLSPAVDVVNGFKLRRGDGLFRALLGKTYRQGIRMIFGLPIRDVDCDFRLIRRGLLSQLRLERTSGAICVELVKKLEHAGARFAEVGVGHFPRLHGSSQFLSVRRVLATLRDLRALRAELAGDADCRGAAGQ